MFVDITDFKGAIAVENILTPYKKGRLAQDKKSRLPKEKITPDVCREVLQSTNYARNIKDMLLCVADLPVQEQAAFKEVVLAVFSQREQPNDILILGKKLAHASGYEDELGEAQKIQVGDFLLSGARASYGRKYLGMPVFGENFAGIDKLICISEGEVAILTPNVVLPPVLEFPNSPHVVLTCSNWADIKQIKLKEGAEICFSHADVLPEGLDLSGCSKVVVDLTDKNELKKLNCPAEKLAFQTTSETYDNTTSLDLTPFGEVNFYFCSYSSHPHIRFRDGAKLSASCTKGVQGTLPDWNYALFSDVKLNSCALRQGAVLNFRKGADVSLNDVMNLPEKLDFSNCRDVWIGECDLSQVKQLVFKNYQQFAQSSVDFCLRKDWNVEIIFADENNRKSVKFNDELLQKVLETRQIRSSY